MYTISEVADLLRVSTVTVRELIANGTIKAIRLSPKVTRISQAEIDRITGTDTTS
ncbi:helix-turn-helix domain-containing protein [Dietzia sp. MNB45]|uniref:helix-turn-helix domain-containing protein n=1 Tax=Dietzia sp. MNB45 TaxID=3238800 RepID=UPI003F7FB7B2